MPELRILTTEILFLRAKLKSNSLTRKKRELLNAELEKNTKQIVTLCRKIRFSKKQIHRFIARLRHYAEEIEKSENVIAQYKKETGLTIAQMEKSWAKMKKSKQDEKRVAKENHVSIDLLKKSKTAIHEAQKNIKQIVREVGIPTATLKTIINTIEEGEMKSGDSSKDARGSKFTVGCEYRQKIH